MVMMRYVLCILALLLSCACVHVLAEEVPAADLSDQVPDTESETKILVVTGDGNCPPGTERLDDNTCQKKTEVPPKVPEAPKEVVPEKKVPVVPPEVRESHLEQTPSQGERNGHGNGVSDAGPRGEVGVPGTVTPAVEGEAEHSEDQSHGTQGGKGPGTGVGGASPSTLDNPTAAAPGAGTTSGVGSSPSGSVGTASDGHSGNSGSSPTGETTSNQGNKATQPSTAVSPTNSATGSEVGDNAALTENGNTSEGTESKNNQEEVAANTDTTTTTTTLPPELTNNKKGDADSSSSISSSVWVRVPLLIVVTLACILVVC
ncbi:uncharacterized protein TM35_000571170 [Trypanosoma theileri]|uniref:Mucin TcMUCII n=1 Tax=Trypanosoma theileri TaxID=67003 RepID=A0A1X0NHY3_9TRYP|nr:uncharacterized protein TM35_000571170 [Trypanosoma theileri]ORC83789.1 hypothetical protein TM35_000571170 [Trypanosoma theileri]